MGRLDGGQPALRVAIEGQQACLGPPVDYRLHSRVAGRDLTPDRPASSWLAIRAHDHELLEQASHGGALVVVEGPVERLGSRRDRAAQPTEAAVCRQRQIARTLLGELEERELQGR